MNDHDDPDDHERAASRIVYTSALKLFGMTLGAGLLLTIVGENTENPWSSMVATIGVAIVAGSLAMVGVAWIGRAETLSPGFMKRRHSSRYRVMAWLLVAVVAMGWALAVWWTISRGFNTW